MKNYVQPGNTLTVPAPRDTLSGDATLIGHLFGVANGGALTGEPVDLDVVGVFTLPKVSALAFAVGAQVYWDDTARLCNATPTDNALIGVAIEAAANPSPTVTVRLDGASVAIA